LSCPADIRNGLRAIRIEGVGQMAIEKHNVMIESSTGAPITDDLNIIAAGPRGPALLQDAWLVEELVHFDRKVNPERRVNAKGAGAHGTITVTDDIIRFGRFCVLPRARQLLVDEQPVQLGSRAFDLLMVLIEAPGTLITKNEIISRIWPDRVVEENNLKMQISALRRVLNADRDIVKTVHGRGYVFTSEITTASVEPDVLAQSSSEPTPSQPEPALPTILSAWSLPHRQWATGSRMTPDEKTQPVVVVIDDDPGIREAIQGLLRAIGLRVESFSSVQEFLDGFPADLSTLGCPDKAGSRFKISGLRQQCARRFSSSGATPMSRCRFGP
jgi:DNA-binding winged helix-turn-helix (wHTH) protein